MTRSQQAAFIISKYSKETQQAVLTHMPIQGALSKSKLEYLIGYVWSKWEEFNKTGLVNMYIRNDYKAMFSLLEELLLLF